MRLCFFAVCISGLLVASCSDDSPSSASAALVDDVVSIPDSGSSSGEDAGRDVVDTGASDLGLDCPSGDLSIVPESPTTDFALQATLNPPRTDIIYGWYDLTEMGSDPIAQGFSLLATKTLKNHTYEVRVASTVHAGCEPLRASVLVRNSPPELLPSAVLVTPSAIYQDDTLTCTVAPSQITDMDGDEVSLGYVWLNGGVPIPGQTASTLSGVFAPGDSIQCQVTPHDGEELGAAVTSSAVPVLNEPPTMTSVSLSCEAIDSIRCTAEGIDLEGSALQFRYEWHLGAAGCEDVPYFAEVATGTDGSVLESTPAKGVNVTCCASAIDAGGLESSPLASDSCSMPNHPPISAGADVVSADPNGEIRVDTTAICDAAITDSDGDAVTKSCTWFVDGEPLDSGEGGCVLSGGFSKNQSICCAMVVSDGESETPVSSKTCAVVLDTAPVITEVSIGPEDADHCKTPTCNAIAMDTDGDDVIVNVAWLLDGAPVTEPVITPGSVLECVATPVADGVPGAPVAKAAVFSNQMPTLEAVEVTSSEAPPITTSFLSCKVLGASDADPCDSVSENVSWVVNNEEVAQGAVLSTELFGKGDTIGCFGSVSDGFETSAPVLSEILVVGDAPGEVVSVTVSPPVGNHKSIFTCTAETSDPDGDPVSLSYTWYVDGAPLAGQTGASISGVPVSQNPTLLTCAATVFGPDGPLSPVPSVNAAALTNALPIVQSIGVTPQAPSTSDVLLCSATGSDADGDPVYFTYEWLVEEGGILTVVSTDDLGTLAPSETALDQTIRCRATPTDGLFEGSPQTSLPVVIGNSPPSVESVQLSPTGGTPSTVFTCAGVGFFDADGTPPAYLFTWFINGEAVDAELGETWIPSGHGALVGDTITCRAAPFDGTATGEAKLSNPVVLTACAGADGVACSDNNACTTDDQCTSGTCIGQPVDCADDNPCTTDGCDPVSGCSQVANTLPCDDLNPCTAGDACAASICSGTEVDCEDDNPCTTSGCAPESGCVQFAVVAVCDDGDPCTVDDYCSGGSCQGGAATPCDDGNPCTTDYCALDLGCTSSPNNGTPCDDGNPCTSQDACSNGVCMPGSATSCDDGNVCTADNCSPESGCTYGPVPIGKVCSDGDACTSGDTCVEEACVPGAAVSCDDENECTIDQCAAAIGCVHVETEGACAGGAGICVNGGCCLPSCSGAQCGDDGCGGSCGECQLNEICDLGLCVDGGEEDMVLVPAGGFLMGCNPETELECAEDEMPQRTVTVDAFLVDVYETTVGEYQACVDAAGCTAASDGFKCTIDDGNAEKPVNCVSWDQAAGYCAWEGKRLCTEAEWEKAARGTDGAQWPWGEAPIATCLHACMNDGSVGCGSGSPFPIGLFFNAVSPYGIYDAVGNIREWTADYYMANYYQVGPTENPTGVPFGIYRVARGGSYGDLAKKSRPSARDPMTPEAQADQVGIRCCKDYLP